jgi:23S rRNA pseudouridine1911/1915/1917 synthase
MNSGHVYRETVAAAHAGRRVVDLLAARWRHGSAEEWASRIARGEVRLDGAVARGDELVASGRELAWHRPPWREPDVPLCFALLHRDEHLLGVAKPAGLPTMPSGGRFLEHTLLTLVRRRWPEAAPLHRLDRGTSGLVLFARTDAARRAGSLAWQRGLVKRTYRGLVVGSPRDDAFTLDVPIGERPHPRIGRVFVAAVEDGKGRPARTRVRVLERREASTLVEIAIETGRPHQIRIHLAHAGHPLVGEPFYGRGGAPSDDPRCEALPGDVGYLLHALRLELAHPVTGATMDLECAPPSKLRSPLPLARASA